MKISAKMFLEDVPDGPGPVGSSWSYVCSVGLPKGACFCVVATEERNVPVLAWFNGRTFECGGNVYAWVNVDWCVPPSMELELSSSKVGRGIRIERGIGR